MNMAMLFSMVFLLNSRENKNMCIYIYRALLKLKVNLLAVSSDKSKHDCARGLRVPETIAASACQTCQNLDGISSFWVWCLTTGKQWGKATCKAICIRKCMRRCYGPRRPRPLPAFDAFLHLATLVELHESQHQPSRQQTLQCQFELHYISLSLHNGLSSSTSN